MSFGFGKRHRLLAALLPGAVFCFLAAADLAAADDAYSWVDKKTGRVVYGSKPPQNAEGVKGLKTKALSRYSSDKVLKRLGWDEKKEAPVAGIKNSAGEQSLPLDAAPAKLKAGTPQLNIGEAGEILGCTVEIQNEGEAPAAEVSVAFEFPDGTLIPGVGPAAIAAKAAATYAVPEELLPFFVKVPGETAADAGNPATMQPKVVVHGAS